MIHRYLHDILTTGIAAVTAEPDIIEEILEWNWVIDSTEMEAVKTYFAANGFNVVNGYPRQDSRFPLIAIILGEEGEGEGYLGDFAGAVADVDDPYYREDIESSIWTHNYRLPIFSEHPDITAAYYEIAKHSILTGLEALTADGCFDYHINGADLAPDPRYMPEHLFGRQLMFSCSREFQTIVRGSRFHKAFQLAGISLDSGESQGEVGYVKQKVTVYTEES